MKKIYCAGPLFNLKEKEEMEEIAKILELNGFNVFLPQRDGFEFASLSRTFIELGLTEDQASLLLNKAIFTLDVYQVLDSDGLILNINGRVPDEGAMVEAGIAWNAGKKVVIYKNDVRSLLHGNDNPLLLGLSNFTVIDAIADIPKAFSIIFDTKDDQPKNEYTVIDNTNLKDFYNRGKHIAYIAKNIQEKAEICSQLINILGESNVPAV